MGEWEEGVRRGAEGGKRGEWQAYCPLTSVLMQGI